MVKVLNYRTFYKFFEGMKLILQRRAKLCFFIICNPFSSKVEVKQIKGVLSFFEISMKEPFENLQHCLTPTLTVI